MRVPLALGVVLCSTPVLADSLVLPRTKITVPVPDGETWTVDIFIESEELRRVDPPTPELDLLFSTFEPDTCRNLISTYREAMEGSELEPTPWWAPPGAYPSVLVAGDRARRELVGWVMIFCYEGEFPRIYLAFTTHRDEFQLLAPMIAAIEAAHPPGGAMGPDPAAGAEPGDDDGAVATADDGGGVTETINAGVPATAPSVIDSAGESTSRADRAWSVRLSLGFTELSPAYDGAYTHPDSNGVLGGAEWRIRHAESARTAWIATLSGAIGYDTEVGVLADVRAALALSYAVGRVTLLPALYLGGEGLGVFRDEDWRRYQLPFGFYAGGELGGQLDLPGHMALEARAALSTRSYLLGGAVGFRIARHPAALAFAYTAWDDADMMIFSLRFTR